MNSDTPTFAVVGAVNHGKSSVVSTLAEDDSVHVSAMPGETIEAQRFSLGDLFVFYDTPGFQNAPEAIDELRGATQVNDPLAVFREFIARHRDATEFDAERRLFAPIVEGAGVIYIVDGSRPALEINLAEMEILRFTGQPRLAIINRTSADDHVQDWKRRLGQHFNAVREFNAHAATFADRIDLLETLAGIEQSWKPKLTRAVQVLRAEWDSRLSDCVEIIVQMLVHCLTHTETQLLKSDAERARKLQAADLKGAFEKWISNREARAHRDIISLFRHRHVKTGASSDALFDSGIFSDETWRAFGLSGGQLVAAGAITGAAGGVVWDLVTAGHSIGIPTFVGTGIGAASAFILGKSRPEIDVKLPGGFGAWKLGGRSMKVGPYKADNFPWILLDRAFGVFGSVVNRSHARRDQATLDTAALQSAMTESGIATANWSGEERRTAQKIFARIRQDKITPEDRDTLRSLLLAKLVKG